MGELVVPKTTDQEWIIKGDFSVWHPYWTATSGFSISGGKARYSASYGASIYQSGVGLTIGHEYRIRYTCDSLVNASHHCQYQSFVSEENFGAGTFTYYFTADYAGGIAVISVSTLGGNAEAVFDDFSIHDWPPGALAAFTFCETWGFCPGSGHRFEHWPLNGNIMQGIRNRAIPMNILYKTESP